MNGLSVSGLADLAGVTVAEVQRLVDLGILVARDGAGRSSPAMRGRPAWARACERWRGFGTGLRAAQPFLQVPVAPPLSTSGWPYMPNPRSPLPIRAATLLRAWDARVASVCTDPWSFARR
jgi:hypothetical protein